MTTKKSRKKYQPPALRVIGSFRRATRGTGPWQADGGLAGRTLSR